MPIEPMPDEQQLIALARRGDADAYGELVRRYQTAVVALTYRILGQREDALDLAQDAFIRGHAALGSFELGRPFGPWIARIAVNLSLNSRGRRRISSVSLDAGGDARPYDPPDDRAGPDEHLLAAEREATLRQAIAELPPFQRATIVLRHYQELSYEEIGRQLAIPLSDVKSHLFRARQQLRRRLDDQT